MARVALAAALAWLAARPEATLLWVTRGATGPGVLRPAGAAAWGLWRSVRRERPELKLRLIDLDPAEAGEVLARLGVGDEQERAHRGGRVLVPRLERAAEGVARGFDPAGVVWLAGGAGQIGRVLARVLVERHGVRHLLITGREARGAEVFAALEASGVSVVYLRCDASDSAAVRRVVAGLERPLVGVFHLAGVLDDGVIEQLTEQRLARVMAAKVDGAWHLHAATLAAPLVAFVVVSSLSGWLGGAGQANYAAANAALDGLAASRRCCRRRWEAGRS